MAVQNSLANRNTKQSFSSFMAMPAVKKKVYDIVAGKDGDRFITSIVTAVSTNPALAECDYASILSAALLGESLKLSPSPQLGQYYLVPYKNKGGMQAQFQIGYKGLIQLAIRSGAYRDIDAIAVKEGELESYDPFRSKAVFSKQIDDPETRAKAKTVGYYAYFDLLNGFHKEIYWTREKMEGHAIQYSRGYANDVKKGTEYSFWSKNFDAMAEKTMLRQLLGKWAPTSIEWRDMGTALQSDSAVIREDGSPEYVDVRGEDEVVMPDVQPRQRPEKESETVSNAEPPVPEEAFRENEQALLDDFFGHDAQQ